MNRPCSRKNRIFAHRDLKKLRGKKSALSVWKTHASSVDGLEAFGANDIISFDKFGSLRKLGMADGELQTIQVEVQNAHFFDIC